MMASIMRASVIAVVLLSTLQLGSCMSCEKEGIFGITTYISCPQFGQPDSYTFCCGSEENRYCCSNPFGGEIEIDQETIDKIVESLPRIIGILVGVVLLLIILCVVCCCCCPFCYLAKRRSNRGNVRNTEVMVTIPAQAAAQPLQPYSQPQPYVQPQGYPAQPQPGYPQPGYPAQQPGYPTGPAAPAPGMPAPGYPELE